MPTHASGAHALHFEDTAGKGLPIVLLHPFPLHSGAFAPQLEALGGRYRLIAPDFRGFGRSSTPARGSISTMETLAEDVLGLLDALNLPEAVFAGVSMGGYVAMALLRLDPGRVKGLVLIDTQLGADDEAGRERREATAAALESRGAATLVESLLPKLLGPKAPPALRARVEGWIRSVHPDGAAAASRGMARRTDARDILARFGGPSLVVVGADDVLTPPDRAREMASVLMQAETLVLEGAGHLSPLEAPSPFQDALEAFLSRI